MYEWNEEGMSRAADEREYWYGRYLRSRNDKLRKSYLNQSNICFSEQLKIELHLKKTGKLPVTCEEAKHFLLKAAAEPFRSGKEFSYNGERYRVWCFPMLRDIVKPKNVLLWEIRFEQIG